MEDAMKRLFALGIALLAGACDRSPEEPRVTVEHAVVTVPAVPGGPGAAYFKLETNNDPTRLVSIASPSIQRVELHGTTSEGGRSRMAPLQPGETSFDPANALHFAPGGKHAMLFGVDPALRAGDKVSLTFTFEPAAPVTVDAEVRGPGQAHGAH
jgi:copper(I)-binding protein